MQVKTTFSRCLFLAILLIITAIISINLRYLPVNDNVIYIATGAFCLMVLFFYNFFVEKSAKNAGKYNNPNELVRDSTGDVITLVFALVLTFAWGTLYFFFKLYSLQWLLIKHFDLPIFSIILFLLVSIDILIIKEFRQTVLHGATKMYTLELSQLDKTKGDIAKLK